LTVRYTASIITFVVKCITRSFVVLILAVILVLSGCSVCESPLAEIIGEWEAEDYILDACAGEIGGEPYLFVMTLGTAAVAKAIIHVLDVDNPVEPVEIASLETPMEILIPFGGLALSGNELYVGLTGSDEAALWVVDVSDPTSPREIALMDTMNMTWQPYVSGNYLAVSTDILGASFTFFDISRPAQPRLQGELALTPRARFDSNWHADYVDSMFYVVDKDGLAIVDVSSPEAPLEVGFYVNPDWEELEEGLEGVEGAGTDLLTGIESTTLEEIFEDMFASCNFFDVAVSDGYAYIAATDTGLVVLDIRNSESPEEVTRLELPDRASRILVVGDIAYIMGVSLDSSTDRFCYSVHIVDVSDPLAPEMVDSIEVVTTLPPLQSLVTLGDYVYFIDMRSVYVIDIYGGCR